MKNLLWTTHSKYKMRQHALSESRVRRTLNSPDRVEQGIATGTIAMMKKERTTKKEYEVWVMVVDKDFTRRIISAWRYPGTTRPGELLPQKILAEIETALLEIDLIALNN